VGTIAGESISIEEYQQAIAERENSYIMQTGQQPGDRQMATIRQQAWEMLIVKHAIESQYEKVGTAVTLEEMEDMLYGKNVNPSIRQSFTDPATGQFNIQQVKNYMKELQSPPETTDPRMLNMWQEQRIRWEVFQDELKTGRARIKYENLLIKSAYVTTAEAEQNYHMQSDVAEVKYIYVPFFSVSDSAINVTDADYKAYYNTNKEKYKSEFTRDLKFVQFPVTASAADSAEFKKELAHMVDEFKNATDDSTFAALNTDNSDNAYVKYSAYELPAFLSQDELVTGTVKGPFIDGAAYKLVKVSKAGKDTVYSARASHILFRWASESDADKKEAKEKARKVLTEIKDGADFAAKAREHGTDGTASNGGDLGWFKSGDMVKPFEKAVFAATKPGLINDIVETDFGYHLISVTNVKENNTYSLAVIEREISPSDASINDALRTAEAFANSVTGIDSFTKRAGEEGITVYDGKNIGVAERRLSALPDARQVIQWLFRDAETGNVSNVFDLQDVYVVAVMTGEIEKGYKPLALVKDEIAQAVKNEAKGKTIIAKLSGLQGTLEEIATAYGPDAVIHTSSDLKLSTGSLPGAGFDPTAVGAAFSPEAGKRTKPFAGERGVLLVEMQNKTVAPAIADYTAYKNQLTDAAVSRNTSGIAEAIKATSDI
ncbi:MAG TPA: peptidylprolyl isomerase, partial [Cyclobacteriaceae bacterium]|nr:peptidylprolyl isomerase [Cyclobacteriaceae bacterium]